MVEYTGPIQHKRATSDVWASATVPLREGEIGVDLTVKRIKVGDGSTLFPALPWATADAVTIAELEALAAQIGDTVSLADAQMTAVQADPESAFSIANKATLVQVRTADGHTLPEGTMVVITLDKTLAEVTTTPVADIDDITFEEA